MTLPEIMMSQVFQLPFGSSFPPTLKLDFMYAPRLALTSTIGARPD